MAHALFKKGKERGEHLLNAKPFFIMPNQCTCIMPIPCWMELTIHMELSSNKSLFPDGVLSYLVHK
jgi:hypothetical protein